MICHQNLENQANGCWNFGFGGRVVVFVCELKVMIQRIGCSHCKLEEQVCFLPVCCHRLEVARYPVCCQFHCMVVEECRARSSTQKLYLTMDWRDCCSFLCLMWWPNFAVILCFSGETSAGYVSWVQPFHVVHLVIAAVDFRLLVEARGLIAEVKMKFDGVRHSNYFLHVTHCYRRCLFFRICCMITYHKENNNVIFTYLSGWLLFAGLFKPTSKTWGCHTTLMGVLKTMCVYGSIWSSFVCNLETSDVDLCPVDVFYMCVVIWICSYFHGHASLLAALAINCWSWANDERLFVIPVRNSSLFYGFILLTPEQRRSGALLLVMVLCLWFPVKYHVFLFHFR